jgi:hypothetical protein
MKNVEMTNVQPTATKCALGDLKDALIGADTGRISELNG